MLPLLIGLLSAVAFGLLSHAVYGPPGVSSYPWIDITFWTLILTGVGVTAINVALSCLPCRISRAIRRRRALGWRCASRCDA